MRVNAFCSAFVLLVQVRAELNEGLSACPESLLSQSMRKEHALRTPLMAAAATGDFAMFTAVKHAVDRAIRLQVVRTQGAWEPVFGARRRAMPAL